MKSIIKLVGLLKLVNKVNERAQTTIKTHDAIIYWYYRYSQKQYDDNKA